MTLLIFIYNLITTIGAFVKEVVYLFDTHLHYEYELNDRIDELHEDLERLQEE
jgi:hypothetical protein